MNVEPHSPEPIAQPEFLLKWEDSRDRGRTLSAGTISILLHVAAVVVLLTTPVGQIVIPRATSYITRAMPLVAPPEDLTQKAPNRGKISKEFDVSSLMPKPALQAPPPSPPVSVRTPLAPAPAPSRGTVSEAPRAAPTVPEPPRVEAAQARTPQMPGTVPAPPPPPTRIQAEEEPKLAFESVRSAISGARPPGAEKYAPPGKTMADTIRGALRGGPGGISIGEEGDSGAGSMGGANVPPSPGRTGSALELLSDPAGADFRPYMARVLSQVRRNWLVIFPEAARLGQRGKVVAQFIIGHDGSLVKVVLAMEAGTKSLNEAAVAALQMSAPFPPFPGGYKSSQVRLQLSFLYNLK